MKMVRPTANRAFTLIEILISTALMALILVSAYLCLDAAFKGRKLVEPRADIFQNARVAMALMTADLRNACPLPGDSAFLGMQRIVDQPAGRMEADNLDFATHNYTPRRTREGDFCEVSYYVDQDPRTGRFGLWRRRNPTLAPDPMAGGRQEEIAENIAGVQFEYSDGLDWYDSWGEVKGKDKTESSQRQQVNVAGLPEAVRITLMLDSDPPAKADSQTSVRPAAPPLVFQTVARLNLADAAQDNSAGGSAGSSDDNGNGNGGQSAPGTPGGTQ